MEPVKLCVGFFRAGVACCNVAWATTSNLVKDIFTRGFAECGDKFKYGGTSAGTKIIRFYGWC